MTSVTEEIASSVSRHPPRVETAHEWRVSTLTPEQLVLGHQRLELSSSTGSKPTARQPSLMILQLTTCFPSFGPQIAVVLSRHCPVCVCVCVNMNRTRYSPPASALLCSAVHEPITRKLHRFLRKVIYVQKYRFSVLCQGAFTSCPA